MSEKAMALDDWTEKCLVPTLERLDALQQEKEMLRAQIAALEVENASLTRGVVGAQKAVVMVYEVGRDQRRPATQDDIDLMQRRLMEMADERKNLAGEVAALRTQVTGIVHAAVLVRDAEANASRWEIDPPPNRGGHLKCEWRAAPRLDRAVDAHPVVDATARPEAEPDRIWNHLVALARG